MADIAVSNVTHSKVRVNDENGMKRWFGSVSFGDGALTYPTGGIPSGKDKYGFARAILSWKVVESNGNALAYEYDISAETIRAFFPTQQTGGAGNRAGVEFTGGSTAPAATVLQIEAVGY